MPVMTEHLVLYGGPRHGQVMRQPDLPELVVVDERGEARYIRTNVAMDESSETRYVRTNMIFLSYQVWVPDYLLPVQAIQMDFQEFEDAIRRQ